MNTIRDIEKYVYDFFSNHFSISSYFDTQRDFNQEKIFRQIIDIEYYLQKNITENNLLLFNDKELTLPTGHFLIDFDHENIKFKRENIPGNFWDTFCVAPVKLITTTLSTSMTYLSHGSNFKNLYLFPVYCLQENFFTGDNHFNKQFDVEEGIKACHMRLRKNRIEALSKRDPTNSFEIHLLKQHANEKSYMILGYGLQDKLCRQHRTLLIKNGDPIKKIVIITDCLDIFIDKKNSQKDITYISWDHLHVEISELDWNILEGCHAFYILTEHSSRNLEDVYRTSVEVKEELDKVDIKSFQYIFLERNRDHHNQLMPTRPKPYIYSFEEYRFLKNPPVQQPVVSLKQYKAQLSRMQDTLLHPYFQTGSATLIYGTHELDNTIFALTVAHAMHLGQCIFKGWREGKKPSAGAYFFCNYRYGKATDHFRYLYKVTDNIFRERNKYKSMPVYIYPADFLLQEVSHGSLSDKTANIKNAIQNFNDSRKFIILDNVFNSVELPAQNILVRELTDTGWCVIIVANLAKMLQETKNAKAGNGKAKNKKNKNAKTNIKLYLKTMTTIDNVIELSPQKPSVFGNIRLNVEIKSSKIVPLKKRKNITCEFNFDFKHPSCNQVSSKKRRKFTPEERDKMKTSIQKTAKKVNSFPDERLAEAKKIASDRAIAKELGITVSMVKKLRRELGLRKCKGKFIINLDAEKLTIPPKRYSQ